MLDDVLAGIMTAVTMQAICVRKLIDLDLN